MDLSYVEGVQELIDLCNAEMPNCVQLLEGSSCDA